MPTSYNDKKKKWMFLFFSGSALLLVAGFAITPDLLISLGPMRQTLTSSVDSIRRVAFLEIALFRGVCFLLAFIFLILALKGHAVWNSPFVKRIREHRVRDTDRHLHIMTGWNFSLSVILSCFAVALIYIVVVSRFLDDAMLRMINREDGVIEYATALIFFFCSILSLLLSFKLPRETSLVIILRLFSAVFFLMAGEEISWGQRIFEVETLEVMKQINVQGENNIHNLFGYFADHVFIAGFFIYGFILPVLTSRIFFLRKLFDFVGLPIASIGLAIGCLIISLTHDWTIYLFFDKVKSLRMAELRELLSSIAFLMLICESWLLIDKEDGKSVYGPV